MTRPVEKRMSPTGPKAGEGGRIARRWSFGAVGVGLCLLLVLGVASLFVTGPWGGVLTAAFLVLAALLVSAVR